MLDFDLYLLPQLSFYLALKVFFPSSPRENHLECLAQGQLLLQYVFTPFPAGVIGLLDLAYESTDLALGLGLPGFERSTDGCQFFLIRF